MTEYIRKMTCKPLQIAIYAVLIVALAITCSMVFGTISGAFAVNSATAFGVAGAVSCGAAIFVFLSRRRLNAEKAHAQAAMFEALDASLHLMSGTMPSLAKLGIRVGTDHHELNIVTTYTRNGAPTGSSLTQVRTPIIIFSRHAAA